MRAKEFLSEINLNIPDQMVNVQIPLSAVTGGSEAEQDDEVLNPGRRAGADGDYKWSPPLQQHLDATKDAIGPTNHEITVDDAEAVEDIKDAEAEAEQPADQEVGSQQPDSNTVDSLKKLIASILSKSPSVPS